MAFAVTQPYSGGTVCAIRARGALECWGYFSGTYTDGGWIRDEYVDLGERLFVDLEEPSGQFTAVASLLEGEMFCGLRIEGTIACWASLKPGRPDEKGNAPRTLIEYLAPSDQFAAVSAGGIESGVTGGEGSDFACGIREDGTATCWRERPIYEDLPIHDLVEHAVPAGQLTSIDVGGKNVVCGAVVDGAFECWGLHGVDGEYEWSMLDMPAGQLAAVSPSDGGACGIWPDGSLECWLWQWPYYERVSREVPAGQFAAASVSDGEGCGIKTDGSVECWAWTGDGKVVSRDAPAGQFAVR